MSCLHVDLFYAIIAQVLRCERWLKKVCKNTFVAVAEGTFFKNKAFRLKLINLISSR